MPKSAEIKTGSRQLRPGCDVTGAPAPAKTKTKRARKTGVGTSPQLGAQQLAEMMRAAGIEASPEAIARFAAQMHQSTFALPAPDTAPPVREMMPAAPAAPFPQARAQFAEASGEGARDERWTFR